MSKGDDTRQAILDEAIRMTSTSGLTGLSIGGLARAVGMSKSGLYAHFESKEDLQVAVLDEAGDRFVRLVVSPALREPRGVPRLRALFENWLHWGDEAFPGGCPFVAASAELDDRPGPVRDRLVAHQRDWVDTLRQAARIARDEGHLADDADVDQLAYEIVAIALGFHHFARLLRDPAALGRAVNSFERLIHNASEGSTSHTVRPGEETAV